MKLSVLVPVYNEADTIAEVMRRVRAASAPGLEIEILVVDDASTDGTSLALERAARDGVGGFRLLRHEANRGKGAAIRTALAAARGDAVLIQDADLEYDPSDYARLVEAMTSTGARAVYGSRILGDNARSYLRYYYGGRFLTAIFNLLYDARLTDLTTGYKLFDRETLRSLPLTCERFEFCPEVTARLARRGIPILEVPIRYHPRSIAEGKKIRWHDGLQAMVTLLKLRWRAPG